MDKDNLITSASLNDFFYQKLSHKNREVRCPLPEEFIFYSSLVLERYATSDMFFSSDEGRVNEKILGIKLLESLHKNKDTKINDLKDVGDTILVQLGFFSNSVKKKLTNKTYYLSLAQNAYQELNTMDSQFYDIPNFYRFFASSLDKTIDLLEIVSNEFNQVEDAGYLLNMQVTHKKAV